MTSEKRRNASFKTYSKRVNHNVEGPAIKKRRIGEIHPDTLSLEHSSLSKNSERVDHSVNAPLTVSLSKRPSFLENPSLVKHNIDIPSLGENLTAKTLLAHSPPEPSFPLPKSKRGTIENFFRPVPSSSSPGPPKSVHPSSDDVESSPTPPSSPPLRFSKQSSPVPDAWISQSRKRRRLSTKPPLPPNAKMGNNQSKRHTEERRHQPDFIAPLISNQYQDVLDGNKSNRGDSDSDRSNQDVRTTNDPLSYNLLYSASTSIANPDTIVNESVLSSRQLLPASSIVARYARGQSNGLNKLNHDNRLLNESRSQGESHEGYTTLVSDPDTSDIMPLISAHASTTSLTPSIPPKDNKRKPSKNLTQTVIATSTNTLKECDDCHYQYNSLIHEEVRSHYKYHENFLARKVPKTYHPTELLYFEIIDGKRHQVRMITRKSSEASQSWALKLLRLTEESLGSLDTVDHYSIWTKIARPDFPEDPNHVPRYRVYVYLVDAMPVSVMLAEYVKEGGAWIADEKRVSVTTKHHVIMCIDRIWTEGTQMRKGYASRLVDCARDSFVVGMKLGKEQVSFSVPTTLGEAFARKYCRGAFPSAAFVVSA